MANQYSFQMRGPAASTSFGSQLGNLGPQLYNALQAGMQTRNDMLDLQDRERLRPNQLAAEEAAYNQSRNASNLGAATDDRTLRKQDELFSEDSGGPGVDQPMQGTDWFINEQLNLPGLDDGGDSGFHLAPEREPYGLFFS